MVHPGTPVDHVLPFLPKKAFTKCSRKQSFRGMSWVLANELLIEQFSGICALLRQKMVLRVPTRDNQCSLLCPLHHWHGFVCDVRTTKMNTKLQQTLLTKRTSSHTEGRYKPKVGFTWTITLRFCYAAKMSFCTQLEFTDVMCSQIE